MCARRRHDAEKRRPGVLDAIAEQLLAVCASREREQPLCKKLHTCIIIYFWKTHLDKADARRCSLDVNHDNALLQVALLRLFATLLRCHFSILSLITPRCVCVWREFYFILFLLRSTTKKVKFRFSLFFCCKKNTKRAFLLYKTDFYCFFFETVCVCVCFWFFFVCVALFFFVRLLCAERRRRRREREKTRRPRGNGTGNGAAHAFYKGREEIAGGRDEDEPRRRGSIKRCYPPSRCKGGRGTFYQWGRGETDNFIGCHAASSGGFNLLHNFFFIFFIIKINFY